MIKNKNVLIPVKEKKADLGKIWFHYKQLIMNNINLGILILRISVAGFMLPHGIKKLFHGVEHIAVLFQNIGLPHTLAYTTYLGEVVAPILILIGFRARIGALLLAFTCLVAIFLAHSDELLRTGEGGGWALELLGLFLLGSISLFFTGAGQYALSKINRWD